jgi:solute carrier family 39 (zinc transporter), member 1/2/3
MVFLFRFCPTIAAHHIMLDAHGHNAGSMNAHGPEGYDQKEMSSDPSNAKAVSDTESQQLQQDLDDAAAGHIIGIAILEFGVILHRYLQSVLDAQ